MSRGVRFAAAVACALGVVGCVPAMVGYVAGYDVHTIYHSVVSVWINSIVVGYIVGLPLFERLVWDVARLVPAPDEVRTRAHAMLNDAWSNSSVTAARAIGVFYGLIASTSTLLDIIEGRQGAFIYLWVPLLIPLLWALALPALWRLIRVSAFLYRLGGEVRVDLGDQRLLGVFTDIGIRHLLIIVLGLSVIPMQAILTGSIRLNDFLPALVVTAPVALIVLGLPILGVHRGVALAKRRELDRLMALLETAEPDSDRFLLLSLYRQRIVETSEWPLSAGSASRVLLYVVIPPLAWTGAAVVENVVSNLLR